MQPNLGFSGSGDVLCGITGAGRDSGTREELCPPVFPRIKKNIFVNVGGEPGKLTTVRVTANTSTTSLEGSLAPRPCKCMYPLTLQFHFKDLI